MKNILFLIIIFFVSGCKKIPNEINNDDNLFFDQIIIKDGSLNGWDLFDAADMQLILLGESETYTFSVQADVQEFDVVWNIDEEMNFDSLRASDFRWTLILRDIDDPGFDEMTRFTFNPFQRWKQQTDTNATQIEFYHEQWHIVMNLKTIE